MPILDLQRRIQECGRIRLGQQVVTANGKKRPAKLDKFRLTSRNRDLIAVAADIYGGTVNPWDAPDGQQWEVITDRDVLDVFVPPADMAFTQYYELWSAGGCQRRCDGRRELLQDRPCVCDPDARECNFHTRLSVMLTDLPGLGVWRLESHGYNAAVELAGAVDVIHRAATVGEMLPARLRLEQRRRVLTNAQGNAETRRFAVPVLDISVQFTRLLGLAGPASGELGAGVVSGSGDTAPAPTYVLETSHPLSEEETEQLKARWSAVPDPFAPPPLADQLAAVDHPIPRTTQRAPLPPTGLAPRPVADVPPPPPPNHPHNAGWGRDDVPVAPPGVIVPPDTIVPPDLTDTFRKPDVPAHAPTRPPAAPEGRKACVICGDPLIGPYEVTPEGRRHKDCYQAPTTTTEALAVAIRDAAPAFGAAIAAAVDPPDDIEPIPAPVEQLPLDDPRDDHDRQRRRFHAIARKRWPDADKTERDQLRKAWLWHYAGTEHLSEMGPHRVADAADRLEQEVPE